MFTVHDKEDRKEIKAIGFTGSRLGMSIAQKAAIRKYMKHLLKQGYNQLHLGCCFGADTEIYDMFHKDIQVIAHPCNIKTWTNNAIVDNADYVYPVTAPITRNRRIVHSSLVMLATPHEKEESLGTQFTIQYSLEQNVFIYILI